LGAGEFFPQKNLKIKLLKMSESKGKTPKKFTKAKIFVKFFFFPRQFKKKKSFCFFFVPGVFVYLGFFGYTPPPTHKPFRFMISPHAFLTDFAPVSLGRGGIFGGGPPLLFFFLLFFGSFWFFFWAFFFTDCT